MENVVLNYEMGGSGNYLSASLAEAVNTYQLKMIENNKISGILPISSLMMNGLYKLQYDITGMSRLIDYLGKGNCNGNTAKKILHSFVYALVHAEDYLLTYKQFLLEKEYIFLNSKGEVAFVYLPLSTRVATSAEEIQEFIKRLLLEHFTADGDAFFLNLLRYISMPEYSLRGLLDKLEDGNSEEIPVAIPKRTPMQEPMQEPVSAYVAPQPTPVQESGFGAIPKMPVNEPAKEKSGNLFGGFSFGKKEQEKPVNEVKKQEEVKPQAASPFGFAVPGMPAAPIPTPAQQEKVKEKQPKEKKPSMFGAFKNASKSKEKEQAVKEEYFVGNDVRIEKAVNKRAEKEEVWVGTQIGFGMQEDKRTVCLSDAVASSEAFIRHDGKRVEINHFPFAIGREDADYTIHRPKVSRKHMYIGKRDGRYFAFDENSTNHTYVNGRMIAPYTEVELQSGDNIRIADDEITFFVEN